MSVTAQPLGVSASDLRVVIAPDPPPEPDAHTIERWDQLRAQNPRLFNGDLLHLDRYDHATRTLHTRRESYMRLAVQPEVETGVTMLAVTGALVRPGPEPTVLLARRSTQTLRYGGLWELAPSGGVEPDPARHAGQPNPNPLIAQLMHEADEELGLQLDPERAASDARALALVWDAGSHSADLVVRLDLPGANDPRLTSWEYDEFCWQPLAKARAHAESSAHELIAPTREILRHFMWA